MSDSMRDRIRDEVAGWPIGSGYYSTTVSVDDARDMADAVLAVLADLPESEIERAAEALIEAWKDLEVAGMSEDSEYDELGPSGKFLAKKSTRELFRAAFGGGENRERS